MEQKKNDYFLNAITNPTFSPENFYSIGITAENTSFQDSKAYKNLEFIQSFPAFLTNGQFDELKFQQSYLAAADGFLKLSQKDFAQSIASSLAYYKGNFLAPKEQRIYEPEFLITNEAYNPQKQKISVWGLNTYSAPTMSEREIAQSNFVYDINTNSWEESPNKLGFFGNIKTQKVLALWDFNADINGNPTEDESKIVYRKGLHKLNYKNQPYYENLDGRSTYGREVLSAWNTITTDNSVSNKFDFFDSDDLEKSTSSTLLKNIVKVAPAFIPGIAPWYIAARVGLEMTDLLSKVAKMSTLFSSDNETLSAIEGFSKTLTMDTSDYGKEHPWSLENILNMGSDVFLQLAEQRWLFDTAPKLLKGNYSNFKNKEAIDAFRLAEISRQMGQDASLIEKLKLLNENNITSFEALIDHGKRLLNATSLTNQAIESALKANYNLGKYLGRSYMTGVTIADAYEEAKEAGMSDLGAAAFMLMYGAAEYGILSTNLGEWILPELRIEKVKLNRMIKTLWSDANLKIGSAPPVAASKTEKIKWYNSIMKKFKKFFDGEYSVSEDGTGKILVSHLFANALGEGIEEVSEEVIRDASKAIANAAAYISGSDVHMRPTYETETGEFSLSGMLNDYALNFVGGFIGGGLGLFNAQYREATKVKYLNDKNSAYLELLYHLRNGEGQKIREIIKKGNFEDKNLSSKLSADNVYTSGTATDNQNLRAQEVFLSYIDRLEDALNVVGAKDGKGILDDLTLKDLRFSKLLDSNVLASYLQEYHSLVAENVSNIIQKDNLIKQYKKDDHTQLTEQQQKEIDELNSRIQDTQKKIEEFHIKDGKPGEQSKQFVMDALFEMNTNLSSGYMPTNIIQYIAYKEFLNGKERDLKDIPKEEIDEYKLQWVALANTKLKDEIRERRKWFDKTNELTSKTIKDFATEFIERDPSILELEFELQALSDIQNIINTEDSIKSYDLYKKFLGIGKLSPFSRKVLLTKTFAELSESPITRLLYNGLLVLENKEEFFKENSETQKWFVDNIFNNDVISTIVPALYAIKLLTVNISQNNIDAIYKALVSDLNNHIINQDTDVVANIITSNKYIHPSTKLYLKEYILYSYASDLVKTSLSELIDKQYNTPMTLLADSFAIKLGVEGLTISKLITSLEHQLSTGLMSSSIHDYGIDADTQEAINVALDVITLLHNHLAAARTDNADAIDPFGYNVTRNELFGTDLAEITVNTYNALWEDLVKLATLLKFYKKLIDLNTGEVLNNEDLLKVKLLVDRYNWTKHHFSVNIPDEWDGKDEFILTLNEIESDILGEFKDLEVSRYPLLTEDKNLKILQADIKLSRAIYKLFNNPANKDKSIIDFVKAIASNLDKFVTINDNELDINLTKVIKLKNMLSYFAAAATLDYSDFLKAYVLSMNNKFVPLMGQLEMLFVQTAFGKSREWFNKFADAYNTVLDEALSQNQNNAIDKENLDLHPELKYELLKDSFWDDHLHIQFQNIFLAEGKPGSGKSTANISLLLNIALNLNKNSFNKKIFVVCKTMDMSDKLIDLYSKSTGLSKDNFRGFTHETYLKYINDNYVAPDKSGGSIYYDAKNELEEDEHGIFHFKYEKQLSNVNKEKPSCVIVDEITNLSLQETLLHLAYLKSLNIYSIATGDFKLTTIKGTFETEGVRGIVYTNRNNFVTYGRYTKLMRSKNLINTNDINEIEKLNETILASVSSGINENQDVEETLQTIDIQYTNIKYVENEDGLFGIKSLLIEDDVNDDIKLSIDLMLRTLNPKEKVTFIYTNENSPLYRYLESLNTAGEYAGKIEFKKGSAQGGEGKYYILEQPKLEQLITSSETIFQDINSVLQDFYTSISRAEQGTLVVLHESDISNFGVYSEKVENAGIREISDRDKINRNNEVRDRINKAVENIESLDEKYKKNPITKKNTEETSEETGESEETETQETLLEDSLRFNDFGSSKEDLTNQGEKEPVGFLKNTEPKKTYANMYSFNTFNPGCEIEIVTKSQNGTKIKVVRVTEDEYNRKIELNINLIQNQSDGLFKPDITNLVGLAILLKMQGKDLFAKEGDFYEVPYDVYEALKDIRYYLKCAFTEIEDVQKMSSFEKAKYTFLQILVKYGIEDTSILDSLTVSFKFKAYLNNTDLIPRFSGPNNVIGFVGSNTAEARKERNKGIYAVLSINLNGKNFEMFETLIYTFPNILSMLESLDIKGLWADFVNNKYGSNIKNAQKHLIEFKEILIEELKKHPNEDDYMHTNLWAAIRLIDVFMANSPYYFDISLNNEEKKEVYQTGPIIVTKDKGKSYFFSDEYEYTADEFSPIALVFNEYSLLYSSNRAYTLKYDFILNDNPIILSGQTFILFSEDPEFRNLNESKKLEAFVQQEKNIANGVLQTRTIRHLLISPPTGEIDEYLKVVESRCTSVKNKNNNSNLLTEETFNAGSTSEVDDFADDDSSVFFGNRATNLRMLHSLLTNDNFINTLKLFLETNNNPFIKALSKIILSLLNVTRNIVKYLETLRKNNKDKFYQLIGRGTLSSKTLGDLVGEGINSGFIQDVVDGKEKMSYLIFKRNKTPITRYLSLSLWKLVFNAGVKFSEKVDLTNEYKQMVLSILKDTFPQGVYYHIPLLHGPNSSTTQQITVGNLTFIPLNINSADDPTKPWTFSPSQTTTFPLMCVSKLDTTLLQGNINPILLKFSQGYVAENKSRTSQQEHTNDLKSYMKYTQDKPVEKPAEKQVVKKPKRIIKTALDFHVVCENLKDKNIKDDQFKILLENFNKKGQSRSDFIKLMMQISTDATIDQTEREMAAILLVSKTLTGVSTLVIDLNNNRAEIKFEDGTNGILNLETGEVQKEELLQQSEEDIEPKHNVNELIEDLTNFINSNKDNPLKEIGVLCTMLNKIIELINTSNINLLSEISQKHRGKLLGILKRASEFDELNKWINILEQIHPCN